MISWKVYIFFTTITCYISRKGIARITRAILLKYETYILAALCYHLEE